MRGAEAIPATQAPQLATGVDTHTVSCPGAPTAPVVVTRTFVIGAAKLDEDTVSADDIQITVNARNSAGGLVTGTSPVFQGNY